MPVKVKARHAETAQPYVHVWASGERINPAFQSLKHKQSTVRSGQLNQATRADTEAGSDAVRQREPRHSGACMQLAPVCKFIMDIVR